MDKSDISQLKHGGDISRNPRANTTDNSRRKNGPTSHTKTPANTTDIARAGSTPTSHGIVDTKASNLCVRALHCFVSIRVALIDRLRRSQPLSIEGLALATLALRNDDPTWRGILIKHQLPCGAWPGMPGGPPNAFCTALAILALGEKAHGGVEWLINLEPIENHWLYQWRFRLFDRQVRFDPTKSGWPWVDGTVSWVAPTAMSILAVQRQRPGHPRLRKATAMLIDRACPAGGWNAGNSVVFGVDLAPQPDFTAMGLLALATTPNDAPAALLLRSVEYLSDRARSIRSPYTLAWITLALAAYNDPRSREAQQQLSIVAERAALNLPPHAAAISALALEEPPFDFKEVSR